MTARPYKIFGRFPSGINNITNPLALKSDELTKGVNVDIDDEGFPSRRKGRTTLFLGNYKWLSDVDENVCLAVSGGSLVSLKSDFSGHSVLRSGISDARMVYVKILSRIYYTNQEVIGYVENGTDYSLTAASNNFKDLMPAGKFLEHYNARMWVAVGNLLIPSDVGDYGIRDLRVAPKQFSKPITMLKAVKDGMFVGAGEIYFMAIDDLLEAKVGALRRVAFYDAIPHMVKRVEGGSVVDGKTIAGTVLFFATMEGVCMGADGGEFLNLTMQRYSMKTGYEGAALYRVNHKKTAQVIMTVAK